MIKIRLTDFNVSEHFELWLLAFLLYASLEGTEWITSQNMHIDLGTI